MKPSDNHITEELFIRMKQGDMRAFDKIYQYYAHRLFSFVVKIIKSEADAEEIVQEVFMKIWESRYKIPDYKLLKSYVFTIAYNNTISLLRKKLNNQKYLEYLKNSSILQFAPSVINEIEYNQLNEQVNNLIDQLPERQKQVYILHREQGLSYAEIAKNMGISKNTVENHMVKALKFLREHINSTFLINILFISLFL